MSTPARPMRPTRPPSWPRPPRSGPIGTILVTHTHVDHAPGAAALAAATGARVVGYGPAEGFAPDERVGEGWTLACPARTVPPSA